jgi:hypothetical protein
MQTAKGKVSATQDWHGFRAKKTERGSGLEPSHLTVVPFENPKAVHGSVLKPVRGKKTRS